MIGERIGGGIGSGAAFARRGAAALGRAAASLVFPPVCVACGSATGEAHALCAACWREMRPIERPFCERLGTPFAVDLGTPLVSPAAFADPPVFARARAALRYDDGVRALLHKLKYGDRPDLARALGGMLVRAGAELGAEADLLVPVPLHRRRLWWRRFNQAAELGRILARAYGKPMNTRVLLRVKSTRPQVGLSRAERGENLRGAFRVPDGARPILDGRRVLLVDDVLTTGATANAAARALLRGGAAAVDVATVATVVADG